MIKFKEHILSNGLTVITHRDNSTPLTVVNLLYKVGSGNEDPDRTGFAHLFEHLMFGGSKNVPDFDRSLQKVGAENNAFTNTDITNYYIILSSDNIETALWAESDRMQFLNLDLKSLETQKNVVIEEFKQRYLDVPYGDVWLKLRPLAYQKHPYRWPTIGKAIDHIENASLKDVKAFHERYYTPDNAVLTLAGNIEHDSAVDLAKKWFGDIPKGHLPSIPIEKEPKQTRPRFIEIINDVPLDGIYKAYHMPERMSEKYVAADLLSDLLGQGKSSRLYRSLVKEKKVFNNIHAYITGSAHPGLFLISGKLNPEFDLNEADQFIEEEIALLKSTLQEKEVEKVKNGAESSGYFSETELLNRAINLSVANALGNTNLVNEELERIAKVTKEAVLQIAAEILIPENCSTLFYKSNTKN
jgi:zinc protease